VPDFLQRGLAVLVFVSLVCPGQETPTFRATTTLIEFTFIALDRKGNPVKDLKKEDVLITEKGKPREIVFFRFEGGDGVEPVRPGTLPAGIFSNRSEVTPGPPRNITAILLDTLNTAPSDQVWVRAQVMRYLRTIPGDTRLAVYAMGTRMAILHDFTDDTESLRARIGQITAQLQTQTTADVDQAARDAEQLLDAIPPELRGEMEKILAAQIETEMLYNENVRERRMEQSLASLAALGNHLAGIPGRKSVVWISGGISMLSITGAMGMGPRGGIKSYEARIQKVSERLAHQGITLYLVDARGLQGPAGYSPEVGWSSRAGRPGPFERQQQASAISSDPLGAMYKMASVTGGRVVINTNDPTEGIRAVAADSRGTYSVGFYATGEPDNKFHNLNLKVRRPGVKLLYRKGYLAEAAPEIAQNWSDGEWNSAIRNPLGSTALRVDARCELARNGDAPAVVNVVLHVAAEDLHYRRIEDKLGAEFEVGLAEKTRIGEFNLRRSGTGVSFPAADESKTKGGVVRYALRATLNPDTATIRLIVRDRFSGRYGTLDVPLNKIPAGPPTQAQ
jgi:VWFA-related protein